MIETLTVGVNPVVSENFEFVDEDVCKLLAFVAVFALSGLIEKENRIFPH